MIFRWFHFLLLLLVSLLISHPHALNFYYYITTTTTIILVTTFMQDIYTYMAETNHVSRAYSVADVQYLQFLL